MNDTPEMIRQRAYRARRTNRLARRTDALVDIDRRLGPDDSKWANDIRQLIKEALA